MKWRVRLGLKVRFPHEKNQNKNLDVLFDFYYGVVRKHCGRIDKDYVQSALSICLLKENHSKYHKMLCCTCSASACWLLVFTAPVLQPSFLCICRTIFRWYFNVKSHLKYLCNYKSRKSVFCLYLFVDGVESAWPARYFSSGNHTDYRSLCIISEKKDSVTGLEVTLQSSSHIFQVTWLTFSPWKCKFIVWILARTHTAKVLTECH